MNVSRVERRLRRCRPVGPPARLRDRILAAGRPAWSWPWVAAAAAVIVLTSTLHRAADSAAAQLSMGRTAWGTQAEDLARRIGGGVAARALAEFILAEHDLRAERDRDLRAGWPSREFW